MLHNSLQRQRKRPRSKVSTASSTPSLSMSDDELPAIKMPKLNDDSDIFKPLRQSPSDNMISRSSVTPLTTTPLSREVIRPTPKTLIASAHQKAVFPTSTSMSSYSAAASLTSMSENRVPTTSVPQSSVSTTNRTNNANGDVHNETSVTHSVKTHSHGEFNIVLKNTKDKHEKDKKRKKKKKNKDEKNKSPREDRNKSPSLNKSPSCSPLDVDTSTATPTTSDGAPKKRSPTVTIRMKDIRGKTIFTVERKPDTDETTVKHNSVSGSESDGDAYSFDGVIPGDPKSKKVVAKQVTAPPPKATNIDMKPPAPKSVVPTMSSLTMKPFSNISMCSTSHTLTQSLQLDSRHSTTITVGTKKLTVTPVPSPPASLNNVRITSADSSIITITPARTKHAITTTPLSAPVTTISTPPLSKATHAMPALAPTKLSAATPRMSAVQNGLSSNADVVHVNGDDNKNDNKDKWTVSSAVKQNNEINKKLNDLNIFHDTANSKKMPIEKTVQSPYLEKLASQRAMLIENKMAGFKLIKPKATVNKEKSISDIINKLGDNVSAKAKSITVGNVAESTTEKHTYNGNNEINNYVRDTAQKRVPSVIPSLSSPQSIQSGLPNKSFMLTTDKPSEHVVNAQTNHVMEKDIEMLKSQSIKLHNNNHKPTLDNVNIVENDSDPVIMSNPVHNDKKVACNNVNNSNSMSNGINGSTILTIPEVKRPIEPTPTKIIQINEKVSTSKTSPVPTLSSATPSQTLLIPDHIDTNEMKNFLIPQPCKRRGTYAKKPTKSALARMNSPGVVQGNVTKNTSSRQPSKMAKMAVTLNARRGRQPIPIPGGTIPPIYNMMPPQMFNYNQMAAYAGQMARLGNPGMAMPSNAAAAVANTVGYNTPGSLAMMAGCPGTTMLSGHSPPGSLLHPTSSPGSSGSSPTFSHCSPDGSVLHNPLPVFVSPTPPSFIMPPTSAFRPGNSHSHLGSISSPSMLANGYDAPLDFTTKRSGPDVTSTKMSEVKSSERTLLEVPMVSPALK